MCNFFSCIITKVGEALFIEKDSHEEAMPRSGLEDNQEHFVRVEYTAKEGYNIDEADTTEWYERIVAKAKRGVIAIYKTLSPALKEYENAILKVPGYLEA